MQKPINTARDIASAESLLLSLCDSCPDSPDGFRSDHCKMKAAMQKCISAKVYEHLRKSKQNSEHLRNSASEHQRTCRKTEIRKCRNAENQKCRNTRILTCENRSRIEADEQCRNAEMQKCITDAMDKVVDI